MWATEPFYPRDPHFKLSAHVFVTHIIKKKIDTNNETYFKDFDKVYLSLIPQIRAFFISCYWMITIQRNFT